MDIPTSWHGLQLMSAFGDMASALSDVYGSPERIDRLLPGSIWGEAEDWTKGLVKRERFLRAQWSSSTGAHLKNDLDMIRPAFFQEVTYDLEQGETIGFKGTRFQVLEADNIQIRYRVPRHFD